MWFTQAGWAVRSPERGREKGVQIAEVRDCVDRIRKFCCGAANKKRDFKRSGSWLPKGKA